MARPINGKVHLPNVLFQPIAAEDVATAVEEVAVGAPLNATLEIGGPEVFRFDDLMRNALVVYGDPREVVTDPHAALLRDRTGRTFAHPRRQRPARHGPFR